MLTPSHLLACLGDSLGVLASGPADGPARQRTLRRTIEWSVDRLDNRDRTLYTRLAIFVGGWSLADAEAVVAEGQTANDFPELVDGLQSFIEKNLVTVRDVGDEPRYGMLETRPR